MKRQLQRVLVVLSHPLVVLSLGFLLVLGTAAQLWWRGMQGADWAYLVAGMFVFGYLGGSVVALYLFRRGAW